MSLNLHFHRFIGVDYSGANKATSRLSALQIYQTDGSHEPIPVASPPSTPKRRRHWNRREIALHLQDLALSGENFIAGIDHGFSFPHCYFDKYGLKSWDAFLEDFSLHWKTDQSEVTVESVRKRYGGTGRTGCSTDLRLTERWTSSAKSVFLFDVQGSVAKSTHAGLPWLRYLRRNSGNRIHFWPFDGWAVPAGKCVIAEVFPSLFRRRYTNDDRTADEHDAYSTAQWIAQICSEDVISHYLHPPLSSTSRTTAALEGWILGVT